MGHKKGFQSMMVNKGVLEEIQGINGALFNGKVKHTNGKGKSVCKMRHHKQYFLYIAEILLNVHSIFFLYLYKFLYNIFLKIKS